MYNTFIANILNNYLISSIMCKYKSIIWCTLMNVSVVMNVYVCIDIIIIISSNIFIMIVINYYIHVY